MIPCPVCGNPMPRMREKNRGEQRTCSRLCSARRGGAINGARRREVRLERVEDIEFLIEQGVDPVRIPQRFGVTASALSRRMYRANRNDLGALFDRVARIHRKEAA